MGIQLSVLIVNWRSRDDLGRCLESLKVTSFDLAPQVVVVDGGSFDGCGEMLAIEFPEVEFLQAHDNLGFGRSNNLGFERVTGNALLLLNPDTVIQPGAIHVLLAELRRLPDVGILGPRLLNTDGSLQTSCVQSLPTPWNQAVDADIFRRLFPNSGLWGGAKAFHATCAVAVEAVSGACMLLRSEVFRRVGGFSPEFFMYAEDMDLCAKVRKLGLTVYHIPAAKVIHHGGGSSRTQVGEFSTVMMRVGLETYMRLNHSLATAFWYRGLQAVSALARLALLFLPCVLLGSSRRAAAWAGLKKWWFVLMWAFEVSPICLPVPGPSKSKGDILDTELVARPVSPTSASRDYSRINRRPPTR